MRLSIAGLHSLEHIFVSLFSKHATSILYAADSVSFNYLNYLVAALYPAMMPITKIGIIKIKLIVNKSK